MPKIFSISLGCPKNRVDTERALGSIGQFQPAASLGEADAVFINTCAFIGSAVKESVRTILEAVQDATARPDRPVIIVGGCLVGRYGAQELAGEIPEVDLWLDNRELDSWPRRIARKLGTRPEAGRFLSTGPAYAYLKISDGCNHACSFCTIPSIRGPLRSRTTSELCAEAARLAESGVKELVLVGQDVAAFGMERGEKKGLLPLLEGLMKTDGIAWIRLMYLYPAGLTDAFLGEIRQLGAGSAGPRVLPYFDVPLQHAAPAILAAMGRPFAGDPQRVVDRIRAALPDAALRTSLIVGFPGEGEAHFEAMARFVEKNRFHHLGVFAYEAEDGTPAAGMAGQVPKRIKEERRRILMETQRAISRSLLEKCAGERLDVLVERENGEWPGLHEGRVWFQAPEADGLTYISGPGASPGRMVSAEIVEGSDYDLTALV